MRLAGLILCLNEEIHLNRCLSNWSKLLDAIYFVDSFSKDSSIRIAQRYNCIILEHKFKSYSKQFNWALSKIKEQDRDWVIKIDCDEIPDSYTMENLRMFLANANESIKGIELNRSIYFLNSRISHGGLFPQKNLRIFKYGYAYAEDKYMDEHILVEGNTTTFPGHIYDICQKGLDFWLENI